MLFRYGDDGIGDHNFCRNPGNQQSSAWCYHADNEDTMYASWEICLLVDGTMPCGTLFVQSPIAKIYTVEEKVGSILINISQLVGKAVRSTIVERKAQL